MTARILVTFLAAAGLAVPAAQATLKPADSTILAQAASPLPIPADSTTSGSATQPATPPAATTPPATATPGTATTPPVAEPPASPDPNATPDDGTAGQDDGDSPDNEPLSLGEIPTIETMELTPDIARRALDSYIMAKTKYADTDLDQYENLQDFVDQTEDGKKFETDVKAAGFANVTDWNLAVTTLGLTYASITDDQTADLDQQIKEVEDDKELAQDMKDKMVKALKALIPSENNKKVIQDLMNDPVYGAKLKQLDVEEE
ncbi:hypothetical protein [Aestuariivirga sp.]|uniref:hypothetical protein n=1 Tax=Aestuariivirga sp. TaxID=2650926 RepID=UPI0035B1DE66